VKMLLSKFGIGDQQFPGFAEASEFGGGT